MLKCFLAGKTSSSYFVHPICTVMVLQSTRRPWKTPGRGQFAHQAEEEKLQCPSVIPAPWNAGIVLVIAGFQSTLKCNWTLEIQAEKGRHCQGQSLVWHAIATSGLIDLHKANPAAILSHWFKLHSVEKLNDRTGCSSASSILFSNFHICRRSSLSCQKSIVLQRSCILN